jgi:hypothetical protein
MKSFFAALRTLVLPFGATTGRRIILDGVNGVIDVYDASGALVAQIDDTGFSTFSSSFPGSQALLTPFGAAGGAELDLIPANQSGVTYARGNVTATSDGTAEKRPQLVLFSPSIDPSGQFVRMILTGDGVTDQNCYLDIDGNLRYLNFRLNGVSQGQGVQFSSARNTNIGVGAQTMVNDAATLFKWRAGRCYRVSFYGRMGTNTAGALAIFKLLRGTTTAASVAIDCGGFKTGAAGDLLPVNISALIANNTGADITQTVQPSLQSNVGTVTWDGSSMPRSWNIEDIGAAADFTNGANAFNTI